MKSPATHCLHGHSKTPENTKPNGSCKDCQKDQAKAKRLLVEPKPPRTHCRNGHPENRDKRGACKDCKREAKKKYLKLHPEVKRERKRRWREKYPEKAKAQGDRGRKKFKENNPGYGALMSRKEALRLSGWTPEMVETTSAEQGHRCMICRQTPKPKKPTGGVGGLCADHEHTIPPKPRALLCHSCNTLLGMAKDSPELCRAAAEYLEAWA